MTEIKLFIAPGSCARVPTILLEEIGLPYTTELVRFMKGQHKSPAYKVHNPKGKVPAILIDGEALTENVAIITFLNECFPDAGLLPMAGAPMAKARQIADLCFCAATLHPIVTRIRMPQFFVPVEAARAVWDMGRTAMREYFQLVEDRLASGPYWYGAQWSAMDAYLYWVFWRVEGANFDVTPYPRFTAHAREMERRPSVIRALAVESQALAELDQEGLNFTPPAFSD